MGANQSRGSHPNEELLADRLRDLELKEAGYSSGSDDNDHVQVNEKSATRSDMKFKAPWATLSTNDIGDWERELLQDPKNR